MEHSTSVPNERFLRTTQLAKLSFNHPSVVLTADVFQHFYKKSTSPWSRPYEVAQVTGNFGGVTTATYSYVKLIEIWVEVFIYSIWNVQPGKVLCISIIRIYSYVQSKLTVE